MTRSQYGAHLLALGLLSTSLTSVASGALGDILFTDEIDDEIQLLSADGSTLNTLVSFADPDTRLAGITQGPLGEFYVANGPLPLPNPSTSSILKITNLFGTPNVTTLASSDPIQNPIGLEFDPVTNQLVVINNPNQTVGPVGDLFEGVLGVNTSTGATSEIWEEDPMATAPRYRDGNRLTADPNSNDFFVVSGNGGDPAMSGGSASVIHRLSIDPMTNVGTMTVLADLSNVGGNLLSDVRDITTDPAGNIYFGDRDTNTIYKMTLDGMGNLDTISPFLDMGITEPGLITYDPVNDRLVFSEISLNQTPGKISAVNLDGTGYTVLREDVNPRTLHVVTFIPAPGTAGFLAGAFGLFATRRRRA